MSSQLVHRLLPENKLYPTITKALYEMFFQSFYKDCSQFTDMLETFDVKFSWIGTTAVSVSLTVPWSKAQIKEIRGKSEKWYFLDRKKSSEIPTDLEMVIPMP